MLESDNQVILPELRRTGGGDVVPWCVRMDVHFFVVNYKFSRVLDVFHFKINWTEKANTMRLQSNLYYM